MVQLLIVLFFTSAGFAKADRLYSEVYLGEKKLDAYSERYSPLIFHDIYQGKLFFEDELFFQNYFQLYTLQKEREISYFLRSELNGGITCPNEVLSSLFDDMQFSYRLITLSYLLEGQWHMKLHSDHFKLKDGCDFDLQQWIKSCEPRTGAMKKFVARLQKFNPRYNELLSPRYKKEDWLKSLSNGKPESYSQYKLQNSGTENLALGFKQVCQENKQLMDLICSEQDELYGLSHHRDAYYLIGQSNIINTYNTKGEAMGCLRRFSEVLSHKEVNYPALNLLFPVMQNFLKQKYEERFLQGRVFFYGSSKEFEDKGLTDLHVKEQTLQITAAPMNKEPVLIEEKKAEAKIPEVMPEPVKIVESSTKKKPITEMKKQAKSAFLQAAEIRAGQNLNYVEVDMLKLKYDYIFTLNMMNNLSDRLKTFITREALTEMATYDKLGSAQTPVPLIFIKFLIDMEEHQGLWNIISVLGDKFYVSNEIDANFSPGVEYIQLLNNESTGRQWAINVLRP